MHTGRMEIKYKPPVTERVIQTVVFGVRTQKCNCVEVSMAVESSIQPHKKRMRHF